MFQVIAGVTALLALHARHIEAQSVLATDCYFKGSSSVHVTGNANPCGVVTPATVRLPTSMTAIANNRRHS